MRCQVCGGATREQAHRFYDDRFGYPGTFSFFRCRRCGHVRLAADFSDAELETLYSDWYPRAASTWEGLEPLPAETGYRAWLEGYRSGAFRWVPREVSILDIGCGFGQTVDYHLRRGCDAVGIEPDAHAAAEAQRHGLPVRQGVFHASDFEPASFDFVTLDQVLEHALDPARFLADVAAVLRPGGQAIISTPNVGGYGARLFRDRWINWHPPYHINLFTRSSIRRLSVRSGLQVQSVRTLTASAWARYQWFHWFTRPPEGVPSPYWDKGRSPLTVPHRVGKAAEWIDRANGFQLSARATDALGIGDNMLAILARPERG